MTIGPATLTVTPNISSTYGGAIPMILPAADYSGFVNGDSLASMTALPVVTTAATSHSPAGNYAVTASGAAFGSNYVVQFEPGMLTISPASLTITPNITSTYGSTLPAADYSGFVIGDNSANLGTQPALTTTATSASPVGGYGVTASGAADPNYTIHYNSGNLTINPAPLTIMPNLTKVYGAAMPTSLPPADFSGLVKGDTPASLTTQPGFTTTATASSGVGSYGVTASGAADANYTISYAAGMLSVTPAPLLITVSNATRLYGAGNPSFTASYSGLVNGDGSSVVSGLILSTPATASSNVCPYAINGSGAAAANYSISYAPGTLTVNPAPLLISAFDVNREYGTANSALTAFYTGLQNNDGTNVVSGLVTASPATRASSVGNYPINLSGATATNYTISYANGTLTVSPACPATSPPRIHPPTQPSAIPA